MSARLRVGPWAGVAALATGLHWLATVAAAILSKDLLQAVILKPERFGLALGGVAIVAAIGALPALFALFRVVRAQAGTRGRGRVMTLAISSIAHALGFALVASVLVFGARAVGSSGLLGIFDAGDALDPLPIWATGLAIGGLSITALAEPTLLGGLVGTWFLLPMAFRRVFWALTDAALLAAAVYVTLELPLEPPADAPRELGLPITRLVVTTLFALRMVIRLLPPAMALVERFGFRPMVAARHLRARKSGFLATIGALSVLAVAVSSCMLTTVLSVMGGFRNDLKEKILGNHAHVVVDTEEGHVEGWGHVIDRARDVPGVRAATPFASGEVMVTSASNLAGAVLRGVEAQTVSEVSDLEENLTRGRIEYLERPELLLSVPPEERRPSRGGSFGSSRSGSVRSEPNPTGLEPPGTTDFLAEDAVGGEERDVLPGIIVGQELARSLRVHVGDDIQVVSPLGELGPTGPMPKTRSFRVAGIFYSGMYEYDMKYVYVTLATAQRFLSMGDAISGIEIAVDDVERAPQVAEAARVSIERDDLRVRDWQEMNKNLFGALALEKLAMFITLGIAILIAGFCVFGTLTLMVQEKGREVGILKAMGTSAGAIVAIFMVEGLLIGVFGAALGLGFGFVFTFAAEHFGIRLNPEVYYIDRLPVTLDPTEFTLVGISAVAVCLLATIFPAHLASKTRPVEALRYD